MLISSKRVLQGESAFLIKRLMSLSTCSGNVAIGLSALDIAFAFEAFEDLRSEDKSIKLKP